MEQKVYHITYLQDEEASICLTKVILANSLDNAIEQFKLQHDESILGAFLYPLPLFNHFLN